MELQPVMGPLMAQRDSWIGTPILSASSTERQKHCLEYAVREQDDLCLLPMAPLTSPVELLAKETVERNG